MQVINVQSLKFYSYSCFQYMGHMLNMLLFLVQQ